MALVAAVVFSVASPAIAATFTFEGLADNAAVPSAFYAGQGISAISGANSFIASASGGSVPFANMPSPTTAILADSVGAIFNVPGGFTSSATVLYAANGSFNTVQVFEGLNGTGTLLGSSTTLADNMSNCNSGANPGDPGCWTLRTVTWAGTAQSIKLPGFASTFYYDNLTLNINEVTGVPEPASIATVAIGLLSGLVWRRLLRCKQ
jgi:hypothetical protein